MGYHCTFPLTLDSSDTLSGPHRWYPTSREKPARCGAPGLIVREPGFSFIGRANRLIASGARTTPRPRPFPATAPAGIEPGADCHANEACRWPHRAIEHQCQTQQTRSLSQAQHPSHRGAPINAQTTHTDGHRRTFQHETPARILVAQAGEDITNKQRRQRVAGSQERRGQRSQCQSQNSQRKLRFHRSLHTPYLPLKCRIGNCRFAVPLPLRLPHDCFPQSLAVARRVHDSGLRTGSDACRMQQ